VKCITSWDRICGYLSSSFISHVSFSTHTHIHTAHLRYRLCIWENLWYLPFSVNLNLIIFSSIHFLVLKNEYYECCSGP
jgi:hypothetical protein